MVQPDQSHDVVAVIPVYRPEGPALLALLKALADQRVPTVVADDASPCTADPLLREVAARGTTVVRHDRNTGIARSLNDGLNAAIDAGATWLLTVDQDSTLPDGYVAALAQAAGQAAEALWPRTVGAVGAGAVDDASGALAYPVTHVNGFPTTDEVIQTGTLWSVAALTSIGGFDESLGIDAVDAAACLRMRADGRRIALATGARIGHRVGTARQVTLLGRSVMSTGHGAERRATMVRNRLRLFPAEFAQSPVHALRTLRRVAVNTALAVTVEDDRWSKAKGSARGLLPRRQR